MCLSHSRKTSRKNQTDFYTKEEASIPPPFFFFFLICSYAFQATSVKNVKDNVAPFASS